MDNNCKNGNGKSCTYSKAMNQPYPRICIHCGKPEQQDIKFEQPKPQYFVRNLSTGKFVSKYSGGNSWSSLGLAMNRLKQVTTNGEGFQIEKYTFGPPEIIDPKAQIDEKKILYAARKLFDIDKMNATKNAYNDLVQLTGLKLELDGYRRLVTGILLTVDKKVEVQRLIDKYLDAYQMNFTETVKNEYVQKIKNETK